MSQISGRTPARGFSVTRGTGYSGRAAVTRGPASRASPSPPGPSRPGSVVFASVPHRDRVVVREHFPRELREERERDAVGEPVVEDPLEEGRLGAPFDLGVDRVDLGAPDRLPEERTLAPRRRGGPARPASRRASGSVVGISSVRKTRPPASGKKDEPPRVSDGSRERALLLDLERPGVHRPAGRGARARGDAEDAQVLGVRASVVRRGSPRRSCASSRSCQPDVVPAVDARVVAGLRGGRA